MTVTVSTRPQDEDEATKMIKLLQARLEDIIDTACREQQERVEEFAQQAGFGSISRVRDAITRVSNTVYNQVSSGKWDDASDEFGTIHRKFETERVRMPDCLDGNAFAFSQFSTRDEFNASNSLNMYSIVDVTKMMWDIAREARRL